MIAQHTFFTPVPVKKLPLKIRQLGKRTRDVRSATCSPFAFILQNAQYNIK